MLLQWHSLASDAPLASAAAWSVVGGLVLAACSSKETSSSFCFIKDWNPSMAVLQMLKLLSTPMKNTWSLQKPVVNQRASAWPCELWNFRGPPCCCGFSMLLPWPWLCDIFNQTLTLHRNESKHGHGHQSAQHDHLWKGILDSLKGF